MITCQKVIFLIAAINLSAQSPTLKWPIIEPSHEIIEFSEIGPRSCSILLYDTNGIPAYLFDCYLSAQEFSARQDYSGDFECWLQPLYEKYEYRTLFTYTKTPVRNWESRGRFLLSELEHPENESIGWGRTRTFRLRGMEITLKVKSYRLAKPSELPKWVPKHSKRINTLTLEYTVKPDSSATESIDVNNNTPKH